MKYYIYIENDFINGGGQCKQLTQNLLNIEVAFEIYLDVIENPDKYIYKNEQIVLNPKYEDIIIENKKKLFKQHFFNTSLGWIKRNVTMKDETTKDFLTDILPLLTTGIPIITYNEPDYTKSELPTQNTNILTNETFLNECKRQLIQDFYG